MEKTEKQPQLFQIHANKNLDSISSLYLPQSIISLDISNNPISNFEGISGAFCLKIFRANNTHINSFKGASNLPSLQNISLIGTPISNNPYFNLMVLIVFGTSVNIINGKKVSSVLKKRAANLAPYFYPYLIDDFIIVKTNPMQVYKPDVPHILQLDLDPSYARQQEETMKEYNKIVAEMKEMKQRLLNKENPFAIHNELNKLIDEELDQKLSEPPEEERKPQHSTIRRGSSHRYRTIPKKVHEEKTEEQIFEEMVNEAGNIDNEQQIDNLYAEQNNEEGDWEKLLSTVNDNQTNHEEEETLEQVSSQEIEVHQEEIHKEDINQENHEEDINQDNHEEDINQENHEEDINQDNHEEGINQENHEEDINQDNHEEDINQDNHEEDINQDNHEEDINQENHEEDNNQENHEEYINQENHEEDINQENHEEDINQENHEEDINQDNHEEDINQDNHEEDINQDNHEEDINQENHAEEETNQEIQQETNEHPEEEAKPENVDNKEDENNENQEDNTKEVTGNE